MYYIPRRIVAETFGHFRRCGNGRRECQVLWTSPWDTPQTITNAVHPKHERHIAGFALDSEWLNSFCMELANSKSGIRVQIHTHPAEAFHSPTDDQFPIIHAPGFLSLVIPNFGMGEIGFHEAFLAEISPNGGWREATIDKRLVIT
jgi:hypothetical protein